jgi:ATP-dependent Clp protease ATP-binding subunit ClpC
MFERYTEKARRLLFFARYETSATGGLSIDSEHMLLGLLREPGPIVGRLLADAQVSTEQLRQEVEGRLEFREKVATSVELPFSEPTKRILNYTAEEADRLRHSHIGPEHVLLALLRVPEAGAGAILTAHGLRLETAREAVAVMVVVGAPAAARPAASGPEATAEWMEKQQIASQIDRIQRLAEQVGMTLSKPEEATELLHLLSMELISLRSRFS